MLSQPVDAFRQNGNLDFRRTCVIRVALPALDQFSLFFLRQSHRKRSPLMLGIEVSVLPARRVLM
jgi:hypothetical protein